MTLSKQPRQPAASSAQDGSRPRPGTAAAAATSPALAQAVMSLAALAQDSRLQVFRLLVGRGPDGACPGDIGGELGLPPATLSFHLKTLQQAGLIDADRQGRRIVYRACFPAVRALIDFLTANCCDGHPERCLPTASRCAE